MNCPNCKNVDLNLSSRAGIEIDYCPECRGVWLDRGELDKLIERESHSAKPAPSHSSDKYSHPGYKKRKSFLEEIFD